MDPVTPARDANSGTGYCISGQTPWVPSISENILVSSACTDAARWRTSVPTRATAACRHRVCTPFSPRFLLWCRLSQKASQVYRALSFVTIVVMWSRSRALSDSSVMKGATYCTHPPRIATVTCCTTLGGASVLNNQ